MYGTTYSGRRETSFSEDITTGFVIRNIQFVVFSGHVQFKLTLSERVLFDVLSADGDVLQEALSGMGASLLHWVLGTQGEDGQVLEWQQQFDEGQVQLLGKDLPHLVALVLQEAPRRFW